MKPFETIREMWEDYAAEVVPPDASLVQALETRRAFYAGAFSMFDHVANPANAVSEEEAVQLVKSWRQELLDFYKLVKQGKA